MEYRRLTGSGRRKPGADMARRLAAKKGARSGSGKQSKRNGRAPAQKAKKPIKPASSKRSTKIRARRAKARGVSTDRENFVRALSQSFRIKKEEAEKLMEKFCKVLLRRVKMGPVQTPLGTFLVRLLKARNVYDISRNKVVRHPPSKVLRLMVATGVDEDIKTSAQTALAVRRRTLE